MGSAGNAGEFGSRYYSFYNGWTPLLTEIHGNKEWQPEFLTSDERAAVKRETTALTTIGPGPNWLTTEALAFAKAQPGDPRAPEALYRAVRATRHGCDDDATGQYSKRAFQLLHQKYPKSEWTKKTPYWFK